MIKYSLTQIAQITGGKLYLPHNFRDMEIENIITDSRTFFNSENTLFFALAGERNNGHDFIQELSEHGLKAFVVSQQESISETEAFILVSNTTEALQELAAYHRVTFSYPVIGITGSNGKTIVKEWLHELLSEEFRIVRSPKSYNSQTGVPLSVLLMDPNYNLGIFEAGISLVGEMKKLEKIIKPGIGILTNIGDAHQENFNSKTQKTKEKLKLFKNSKKLIFNVDNINTAATALDFCKKNSAQPLTWSAKGNKADIKFKIKQENGISLIEAGTTAKSFSFKIPFTDKSSIENICHCFAAVYSLSKNPEKILPRFSTLSPVAMRLEIKEGINNCLLINDYYNSDLTSLTIALSVLRRQAKHEHLKKQIILSDIQQTGLPPNELYSQVNQLLEQWGIDKLTGIGPEISAAAGLFSMKKEFYSSVKSFENSFSRNRFSDSAILIKGARSFTFEKISELLQQKTHQTVLEIDLNALVNNLNIFRSILKPSTKIMVMVKAFSYGSGDIEIAKLLQYQHADYLAVAVADEGTELRQAGIRTPVIVMNPEEHSFQNIIDFGLEPNIYSYELLKKFDKTVSENALYNYPVHIKLDTGMNRLGFKTEKEVESVIAFLKKSGRLKVISVFSHLSGSDEPDLDYFTNQQFGRFETLSKLLTGNLPGKILLHILNSAGIERFPEKQMDMIRLGIGLYGITITGLRLENISTFKSAVSQVKELEPDETTGYGRKGEINRKSEIAIVPVGYADGMSRILGNRNGEAFIKGKRVPVIGNICMDMLMLDVTGLNVTPGETVEFFGNNISITEVAERAGTIPYEIFTGISQRVKRVYLQE